VVIATPGRLLNLLKIDALDLQNINLLIMDECNKLFENLGYILGIFKFVHPKVQMAMFSHEMPDKVLNYANNFMNNPV
jgi:superfamily II DNA/RNA helicase